MCVKGATAASHESHALLGVAGHLLINGEFTIALYTMDTSEYFDAEQSIVFYTLIGNWTSPFVDFHITYINSDNAWGIFVLDTTVSFSFSFRSKPITHWRIFILAEPFNQAVRAYSFPDWNGVLDPARLFGYDPKSNTSRPFPTCNNFLLVNCPEIFFLCQTSQCLPNGTLSQPCQSRCCNSQPPSTSSMYSVASLQMLQLVCSADSL